MPFTAEEQATELLNKVTEMIQAHFPEAEAQQIISFANLFFFYVSSEDVLERGSVPDIYGAVITYWNFARDFSGDQYKIRVYNPQFEQDGWQSTHTVISLVIRDAPFLVDSIRMAINRLGLTMHLIIHPVILVRRDSNGHLCEVVGTDDHDQERPSIEGISSEAVIHVEIDHQTETTHLNEIRQELEAVLNDLQLVVTDWQTMQDRLQEVLQELRVTPPPLDENEISEVFAFLNWLSENHFTFLGYREYRLEQDENKELCLSIVPNSGLGLLSKDPHTRTSRSFAELPPHLRELAYQPELILLTKANTRSTIHRPSYMDYIGVRIINDEGQVVGEKRFLGLYTSAAYHLSTRQIPLLRRKVLNVFANAGYRHNSHRGKSLMNILETYPRDELFQISEEILLKTAIGILQLQERQRIRLFVRPDTYGRFISCIIFVPRDHYDSGVRQEMQQMLTEAFGGDSVEFNVLLSESVLAQVHFVIRTPPGTCCTEYDVQQLETRLKEITRAWKDMLFDALIEHTGEEHGTRLFRAYEQAFPVAYREDFSARYAVYDIERMEMLNESNDLTMSLYRPIEALDNSLRLKLFHRDHHISLSEVLPMLENMGVKVLSERSYQITAHKRPCVWIQEFGLLHAEKRPLDTKELQKDFQALFTRVWQREIENDGFNRLILRGRMNWREIVIFRAYYHYLKQTGLSFSQLYIEQALANNPAIARVLLDMFHARCNPDQTVDENTRQQVLDTLSERMRELLESVASLDEDRILQRFLAVIMATLRTNYFQKDVRGEQKPYLSFKFDPAKVPELPEPRPMFEIFVYSPRVEGVHLRGGKVARGGLRWSDRYEDFRTEVLGLVKAQMVKNAVIVPVGSKGGFVAKQLPSAGGREAIQQEGIACYETFISGLLDVTDNLIEGKVVPPPDVLRYDEDDPYLVVAADKGTATFSDIANRIAQQYGFWLGDAFASGGSAGYDHKKMGITARGAWESVKRHFRELGLNTQAEDFSVVGIGDMSGDVFGNGMLLSRHIKLIGAFNHLHIFLDPNPDPEASFNERERMFNLPRSSWEDYNRETISKGGGVYSRSSKSIVLSPEVREVLGIKAVALAPNELIRAMLCAEVDLLWNGGIGTYVKAQTEHNTDVGDRTNDGLRVNGNELRCRVIGEGGNLGFTQLGRIEYALTGGRVNTDAMDNSAGVDCSDHEVNIKILLNAIVHNGDMTTKQRDQLLADMTDEVGRLVIRNNYLQTQAVSLSLYIAWQLFDAHARFIKELERHGKLARELEFLPNDKTLAERRAAQQGFTAPEICVVLAYSKITLYEALIASDLPDEPALKSLLLNYFPRPLPDRFVNEINYHRLRREIIATELTNKMVNRAGSVFVFLLQEETGNSVPDIVRSFVVTWEIFDLFSLWQSIESLDNQVAATVQLDLMLECRKLAERGARWLLRNRRQPMEISETIHALKSGVHQLSEHLLELLEPADREGLEQQIAELVAQNVPAELAQRIAGLETWLSALDIVEVANNTDMALMDVATVHFHLGTYLKLHWLRDHISALPRDDRWTALSRSALRDELYRTHRELTISLLQFPTEAPELSQRIEEWTACQQKNLDRLLSVLSDLSSAEKPTMPMLSVALREIRNLL